MNSFAAKHNNNSSEHTDSDAKPSKSHLSARLIYGIAVGLVCSTGFLAVSYLASKMPAAAGDVSLKWVFTPWWRHWQLAIVLFQAPVLLGLWFGLVQRARINEDL